MARNLPAMLEGKDLIIAETSVYFSEFSAAPSIASKTQKSPRDVPKAPVRSILRLDLEDVLI